MSDLDESRIRIDALVEEESIPNELRDGLTIQDLQELISQIYTSELQLVDIADSQADQQEVVRAFVERVALKVGLICLDLEAPTGGSFTINFPADQLTALLASLMRHGGATLQLVVDE